MGGGITLADATASLALHNTSMRVNRWQQAGTMQGSGSAAAGPCLFPGQRLVDGGCTSVKLRGSRVQPAAARLQVAVHISTSVV